MMLRLFRNTNVEVASIIVEMKSRFTWLYAAFCRGIREALSRFLDAARLKKVPRQCRAGNYSPQERFQLPRHFVTIEFVAKVVPRSYLCLADTLPRILKPGINIGFYGIKILRTRYFLTSKILILFLNYNLKKIQNEHKIINFQIDKNYVIFVKKARPSRYRYTYRNVYLDGLDSTLKTNLYQHTPIIIKFGSYFSAWCIYFALVRNQFD